MRFLLVLIFLFPLLGFAQQNDTLMSLKEVELSDSVIFRRLEEINVFPRVNKKINTRRYSRMISKIKKVYPFAKQAAIELEIYNQKFVNITNEREKKKYIKHVEKQLFEKYGGTFENFTILEGRYLMLLIDRETSESSYELIKELRGTLPALFWQGIARLFGNDLKERYDPHYKHFVMEQIVLMIERGDV